MAQSSTEQDQEKASMEGRTCLLSRAKQNMGYAQNTSAFGIVNPTPTPYMIQKAIQMGQSPYQQPKNKICCAILNKSESLPLDCNANMVHKHQSMQHGEGRDVVPISPHTMSSIGELVNGWNKIRTCCSRVCSFGGPKTH
jgi:hypothetical protein